MTYYVRIDDPRAFRRHILESSKQVIGSLQANRKVQDIRKRKREALDAIRQDMKEITMMVSKLDELLPQKELRDEALKELEERRKRKEEERKRAHREATEVREQRGEQHEKEASEEHEEKSSEDGSSEHEAAVEKSTQSEEPVDEEKKLQEALSSIEKKLSSLK